MGNKIKKVITLFMLLALIISNISFAEDIDKGALEVFLEELSNVSKETRKNVVDILKIYFNDDENGIDELVNDIDIFVTDEYIRLIESKGYTLDDVKVELSKLKSWTKEEKSKLLYYLESGNIKGIRSLINQIEEKGDTSGSIPSQGGSGNAKSDGTTREENQEKLLEVYFKDIENHRYEEDIIYLAQRGIIEGRTKEIYDPDGNLTRAEFTTLITRLLKLPLDEKSHLPFEDVKEDSWYYEFVKAAYDSKIIEGVNKTTFAPNRYITRQEMVKIIVSILENKGILHSIKPSGLDVAMYIDSNNISDWAKEYLFYGVKYGLIEGRTETELAPREFALRGEAANTIRRLYDILKETQNIITN